MHDPVKDIEIREASLSDATELGDYLEEIYKTEKHLISRPDEFIKNSWRQRRWLKQKITNPLTTCLFAKDTTKRNQPIIGMLDSWTDSRARVRHVTTFAMTVSPDWQGQGVGRALLRHFCSWVAVHPVLEKIELHVHDDNLRAIQLYEKTGFEREGLRRLAVRYEDGRDIDDIIMGFWPEKTVHHSHREKP